MRGAVKYEILNEAYCGGSLKTLFFTKEKASESKKYEIGLFPDHCCCC
jgi:hypothetical protein